MAALPPPPGGAWLEETSDGDELAALDWLLSDGAVGLADAAEQDEFMAHALLSPQAAPPAAPLRCLDPAHTAGCGACLPPPPEGQDALWMLQPPGTGHVRGAEGPNGSCLLRAQLLATEQWNSRAAREALAAAEEARGDPTGVAKMLHNKAGKLLLKPHMLCLVRAWGYASDLWRRRGMAGSSRKRARGSDQPSQHAASRAVAAPRLLPVVEPLTLSPEGVTSALRVLWRPATETLLGPNTRTFALRTGYAFAFSCDADFGVIDATIARLAAAPLEATQVAWNEALRAHLRSDDVGEHSARLALPDSRLPMCMAVPLPDGGDDAPVEAVLRSFIAMCTALRGTLLARRSSAVPMLSTLSGAVDLSDVIAEVELIFMQCRRFAHEALLVLQYLKVRGSCDDYMSAAADTAREIIRFGAAARVSCADQHSWLKQQCDAGVLTSLQTDNPKDLIGPRYEPMLIKVSVAGAASREEIA